MPTPSRTRTTDKRLYGVDVGIVTDNVDPEKEGRVKVMLPWFDDKTEIWCRVRQLYAGKGYGAFWIPEVGDEVLVAFGQGDMRFGYVLGGLYNGKDKPATHRAKDKDEKLFQTKAGHKLRFVDTAGEESIRLETKSGSFAELNDKEKKITLKTNGGIELVLDDGGKKATVKTAGGPAITLDAASGTATIEAKAINLGGPAASEPLILGSTFLALFGTHVHTSALPGSPTTPPVPPIPPTVLSLVSKTA